MAKLVINKKLVTKEIYQQLDKICPFGGFTYDEATNDLDFNAACKSCKLCARKGPKDVVTLVEEQEAVLIDKSKWNGVAVWVETHNDKIHPVSLELIGKAKELASVTKHEVFAVIIGDNVSKNAEILLSYGVDKVYSYERPEYKHFDVELYVNAMQDFVDKVKPSSILYGATSTGRSFGPRVAARYKTGLTADCTILDMKENTDLIQIRPAFGGNVMAQIICPNHRPQMATVRYKIFKMPEQTTPIGEIIKMDAANISVKSNSKIIDIKAKEQTLDISEAEVIVACGRPFKTEEQMAMAQELADLVGGVVAITRPLVESGLRDAKLQIGLSGRTVAPKLIFNLGIHGAVQYTAGMTGSETIITINSDPNAPIFDVSHYGIVGDVFKVVPALINKIKESRK